MVVDMLNAYNNDVKYQEKWYHIQTEDNGIKDGHITTNVFFSGQVLDSKSTSYRDAIAGVNGTDAQNAIIKEMMEKQHLFFINKLNSGSYDALISQRNAPAASRSPRISQPAMAPLPQINRQESNNLSGFSKTGKPDIVRASSQQMAPAPSGPLGIKSIAGIAAKPGPTQPPLPSLRARKPSIAQPAASLDSAARLQTQPTPVPVSASVAAYKKAASKKSWRGFRWPEDDLAINTLVASLLETTPAS